MIKSVRLSRYIAIAFVISVFVLITFCEISKFTNDWTWFARSGSILVCIGVLTAAYDIKSRMENTSSPESYISQTIIIEASIVVIGTIIGGFGDLIGQFS